MHARRDPARALSILFAAYAAAGGLLSFLGWALDVPRLIDWWNTGITIKTNTCLCLIALGGAVLVQHVWPRAAWAARLLALPAGVFGVVSMVQHIFGIDLKVDTLIFDEEPGSPATASPNRTGPPASISFMLLTIAFWMVSLGSRSRAAVALPLLVLVAAMLSIIGYVYGAEAMYTAPRLTGIAVQTATMTAALATALMAMQMHREPLRTLAENSTAGDLARRLIPLAIVVPVGLGLLRVEGQRAGYFDLAFGSALRSIVEILLLTSVLWWSIHVVRARDAQRRDAEDAQYRGERRLRRVLDASAVPFMVLSPVRDAAQAIVDFRWTYVNKSAATTFGRDASLLMGAKITELYPATWDEPGLFEHFTAAADQHEVRDFEVRNIADGVRGWFQVVASSLDQDIGVWFTDVSERKHQEMQLRDADQRKDEFLATLAHELRNPLAPIRMAATLARRPDTPPARRQWCQDVIERQVQHMALLLDDLLDVSRITRGILEVRRVPTPVAKLVESAIETSRPLIDHRQHQLQVELPRDGIVDVDPLRMAQVISNLLNNAAKYTAPGGQIRLAVTLGDGDLRIVVSDTGIGIAREDLDAIFNMFSQVKSSQDRSEGGLGIGLALTRGLVKLHGGRVSAWSEGPGMGSTFSLHLPRVEVQPQAASAAATADDGRATEPLRILIADDNRDAADSLALLLRGDGHEVFTVNDGEAALAVYEEEAPQAALLDLGMPRLSGLEVAQRIRARDAGILLIAITGWGQSGDRARTAAAGFDHHLTKPVEFTAVAALLHQRGARRAGTAVTA